MTVNGFGLGTLTGESCLKNVHCHTDRASWDAILVTVVRFWSPHVENVCTVTQIRLGEGGGGGIPLGGGGVGEPRTGIIYAIYIYIYICLSTYIHTYINPSLHPSIHPSIHIQSILEHIRVYYMYILCVCVYIHIHIYIYICGTYVCVYIYIRSRLYGLYYSIFYVAYMLPN